MNLGRSKFLMDGAIGRAFGSTYVVDGQQLRPYVEEPQEPGEEEAAAAAEEHSDDGDDSGAGGRDNRHLIPSADNQAMTAEEIVALKKHDAKVPRKSEKKKDNLRLISILSCFLLNPSGEQGLIDQLVAKSATFESKTEFSKEKYIRKKKRK